MKKVVIVVCLLAVLGMPPATSSVAQPKLNVARAEPSDVTLEIKGDTKIVKVDRVVIVKEDLLTVNSFPFTVTAPTGGFIYSWQYPPNVEATRRGNRLEVAKSPRGMLTIFVEYGVVDFKAQTTEIKFGQVSFSVGAPDPKPPEPPKPPQPPVVETLGFVTLARDELAKVPAEARVHSAAVADNFDSMASKLAATASMTIDQANAELKAKHGQTLAAVKEHWLPFFRAWAAKANELNDSGKLSTREHYVTAYTETAAGLRAK